jgi:integrase/recombinase XerD
MLTTYRRHNPEKCRHMDNRCKCPIWVRGHLPDGRKVRRALKERDWTKAQMLVRNWEVDGTNPRPTSHTIEDWRDKFIDDAASRGLSESTMRLYRLLFKQLIQFASDRGYKYASEIDLDALTDFRVSWKISGLSSQKKLYRLRDIYRFAVLRKIAKENFALHLKPPTFKSKPTLPFSESEMDRILKAAEKPEMESRVKAFILTMRYSGLRISDVATLALARLAESKLRLHQAKTGEYVYVPLPAHVADTLRAVPTTNTYFFWSGKSKLSSATGWWRAKIAEVFKAAKIEGGHTHRFRDTFAVSCLERGVSIESVSRLLGHSNIAVTQKHYNPWVKTRQDALDREMEKVLNVD